MDSDNYSSVMAANHYVQLSAVCCDDDGVHAGSDGAVRVGIFSPPIESAADRQLGSGGLLLYPPDSPKLPTVCPSFSHLTAGHPGPLGSFGPVSWNYIDFRNFGPPELERP